MDCNCDKATVHKTQQKAGIEGVNNVEKKKENHIPFAPEKLLTSTINRLMRNINPQPSHRNVKKFKKKNRERPWDVN